MAHISLRNNWKGKAVEELNPFQNYRVSLTYPENSA